VVYKAFKKHVLPSRTYKHELTVAGRVFGALFKNSLYGQEIDQRILNIQKCKERFRAEADKFLHYRLKAMDDTALQTLASTEETKEGVDSVAKIVVQGNEQAETNHLALMRKLSLKNEHTTNILNNIRNVLGGAMENMECESDYLRE